MDHSFSKKYWNNEQVIRKIDRVVRGAHRYGTLLLSEAFKNAKGNSKRMAEIIQQPYKNGKDYNYCYKIFWNSIISIYFLARSNCYKTHQASEWKMRFDPPICYFPPLKIEDQLAFFSPGKPQYYWRLLHNDFVSQFREYGLFNHPLTGHFYAWIRPDEGLKTKVIDGHVRFSPPDTRPDG